MRDPLLAPLACLIAGIVAATLVPLEARPLWLASLAFAGLAGAALALRARRAAWLAMLATVLAGGALTTVLHAPGPPPEIDAGARELLLLEGCVVEPTVFSDDREQFTLELDRDARARVSLQVRPDQKPPVLSYGQHIEIEASVRKPRNFGNPGAFDYVAYLARSRIYWTASAPADAAIRVLPGRCGSRFWQAIFALRTAALERIEHLYSGDLYSTAMVEAILIGETAKMQRVWTEHFRRTGTYHALVISGMHVTVLAATLLLVLRLCFVPELWRLFAAMLGAWLYALVSGWQPPVVRSAGGFTLFLIGRYFYRQRRLLNLLAAVALVILAFDPQQLFDASFQLSFLAVAVIGALAAPLLDRSTIPLARGTRDLANVDRDLHLEPRVAQFRVELRLLAETVRLWTRLPATWILRAWGFLPRLGLGAFNLMLISAVVQIGLALPMILYFHRVSLSGLSANVIVVPLMELMVPVGFAAIFTGWHWVAWSADTLLRLSERVAAWHVQWEPNYRVPDPPLWLSIGFSVALLALAFLVHARWWLRLPVVAVLLELFVLLVAYPFAPRLTPGVLELSMIDVGQGESLLVALPDGRLLLEDGGGFPHIGTRRPRMDIGEDVVSPYLWHRAIRRLDIIALTHGHSDHSGGLPALIENFRPRELWIGAMPQDDADWMPVRDKARQYGVRIVALKEGDERLLGGVRLRVLAPAHDHATREKAHNNDSLVLSAAFGARTFLLTGDIERPVEWDLLDRGLIPRVDVLKAAHHGSKTSTTEDFLERAHPAFALISAGLDNSYRLPSAEVIERLQSAHVAVLRTDQFGLITVRCDGRRLAVETARTGIEGQ